MNSFNMFPNSNMSFFFFFTLTTTHRPPTTLLIDTTTTPPESTTWSNNCPPDVECLHGFCLAGSVSCVCDRGWAGFKCDQQCPEDCMIEGACQTTQEGKPFCWCQQGYTYVNTIGCIKLTTTTSTTTTTTTTTPPTTTTTTTTTTTPVPTTSTRGTTTPAGPTTTTMRPLEERTCMPGFICEHGACSTHTIRCDCDTGWTGPFCTNSCTKRCGHYGSCSTYPNGTNYCQCTWPYTGEFCQQKSSGTQAPVRSSFMLPTANMFEPEVPMFQDTATQPQQMLQNSGREVHSTPQASSQYLDDGAFTKETHTTFTSLDWLKQTANPSTSLAHFFARWMTGTAKDETQSTVQPVSKNPNSSFKSATEGQSGVTSPVQNVTIEAPRAQGTTAKPPTATSIHVGDEHSTGYSLTHSLSLWKTGKSESNFTMDPPEIRQAVFKDTTVSPENGTHDSMAARYALNSSTQTNGLRPMRERQCLSDFVCKHGTCAAPPMVACVCDEGWHGIFCETEVQNVFTPFAETLFVPPTPKQSTTTAPETTHTTARTTKPSTSTPVTTETATTMVHTPEPTSTTTKATETTQTTTGTAETSNSNSLRPLSERQCVPGFVCKHGKCTSPRTIACTCDPSWSGTLCETEIQTVSWTIGGTNNALLNTTVPCTTTTQINGPSELTLRPLEERLCMTGFVCYYGKCATPPTMACVCDSGWDGTFCDTSAQSAVSPADKDKTAFEPSTVTTKTTQKTPTSKPKTSESTTHQPTTQPATTQPATTRPATILKTTVQTTTTPSFVTTSTLTTLMSTQLQRTISRPTGPLSTTSSTRRPVELTSQTVPDTTLRPLVERECIPHFVCQHGRCAIPPTVGCLCDSGWDGMLCDEKQSTFSPSTPTHDTTRHFESTARPSGETSAATGSARTNPVPVPTSTPMGVYHTTLRPLSERACQPEFICQHGKCAAPPTMECLCDGGWVGVHCDVKTQMTPEPAGQPETSASSQITTTSTTTDRTTPPATTEGTAPSAANDRTTPPTTTDRTTPPATTEGTTPSAATDRTTPPATTDWTTPPATTHSTKTLSQSITTSSPSVSHDATTLQTTTGVTQTPTPRPTTTDTLSSTTVPPPTDAKDILRPLSERKCRPGFVCQHGTCDTPPTIACVCDLGWTGVFCEYGCSLDCGLHGKCVTSGDNVYCQCVKGYIGDKCQQVVRENISDANESYVISNWTNTLTPGPVDGRRCAPGFVCMHGNCSKESIACICDKNYIGFFCEQWCPLDCVDGECKVHPNDTAYCSCNFNSTGVNCSETRIFPDESIPAVPVTNWHWYVIGAAAALMVVLIIVLTVVPYVMWKKGHIFFMKIVYRFQNFEDDDDKLYDAFVSYKGTDLDEKFVVTQLFPKLEQELKFRLCLHFRDFIPGDTIANNIIRAVENSRRTILVLSPEFIKSEFCRFEYQRAQVEMLKRRQRIIPIILRDISREKRNMDESLRAILETITYLDWPADNDSRKIEKFWKRLELSMPKRKAASGESSVGDSSWPTTSTQSSSTASFKDSKRKSSACVSLPSDGKRKSLAGLISPNDVKLNGNSPMIDTKRNSADPVSLPTDLKRKTIVPALPESDTKLQSIAPVPHLNQIDMRRCSAPLTNYNSRPSYAQNHRYSLGGDFTMTNGSPMTKTGGPMTKGVIPMRNGASGTVSHGKTAFGNSVSYDKGHNTGNEFSVKNGHSLGNTVPNGYPMKNGGYAAKGESYPMKSSSVRTRNTSGVAMRGEHTGNGRGFAMNRSVSMPNGDCSGSSSRGSTHPDMVRIDMSGVAPPQRRMSSGESRGRYDFHNVNSSVF